MRVRDVLDSFSLTSLSNVCLAMGRLMFLDKPLMAALGRRVRAPGVLDQAPPRGQSISNILWAFAVLEVRDTALLQALAEWLVEGKVCPGVLCRGCGRCTPSDARGGGGL